jgi:hypothetical protein
VTFEIWINKISCSSRVWASGVTAIAIPHRAFASDEARRTFIEAMTPKA